MTIFAAMFQFKCYRRFIFQFIILSFLPLMVFAQEEKASAFVMESLTYKFHSKWNAYIEIQQRALEDLPTIDYYEFKGGVTYFITPQHQPFIGMGRYVTYKDGDASREEFRMWIQYVFSHNLGRIKFEHRGRAEQRFFHNPQTDENTTANRYRYRLNISAPVNNPKMQPKTFFLNTFNEIFFVNESPSFARNRFYFGGGYQFSKLFTLGLGYMNQKEFSDSGDKIYHFAYMALNFTIGNSSSKEQVPHTPVAD